VLAENIHAFRDSPAIDVSAMDGYAVRLDDVDGSALSLCGTATAGSAPIELRVRSAIRVFTGGPVPSQAECVVRREDCNESESYVTVCVPRSNLTVGLNIRRQGENARAGSIVVPRGTVLSATRFAGAMTFLDQPAIEVFQKTRLAIINTGDELIEFGDAIEDWQIRDSNGPFLQSMLLPNPWLEVHRTKVEDQHDRTEQTIREQLERRDVILLTGGVSMGDTDFVPDAILACGGEIVFHRIPIRPGKPMLGAVGPEGQLILGLPGNPLSVAVTFRRFAWDLIRHVSGFSQSEYPPKILLETDDTKALELSWFRLVSIQEDGTLRLVSSQGSGDIASLLQSDGFVEIPPNALSAGLRSFYSW